MIAAENHIIWAAGDESEVWNEPHHDHKCLPSAIQLQANIPHRLC